MIETPLVGDLDVNGWDLSKALKLMLKGNAVVLEWLRSPFIYGADADFRKDLLTLAERHADKGALARHYLHLGENQRRTYFADEQRIAIKKLFYALRPAAALRWMRLCNGAVPPMHFPTLMQQSDPPAMVVEIVEHLLVAKARTRELGEAPLPKPLAAFIDAEFAAARDLYSNHAATEVDRREADAFFRATVMRFDTGGSAVGS